MKTIYKILLFLFSITAFAQPKPVSYTRLILTQNPLKVSAQRVIVQDPTSFEFGYMQKDDLIFYNEYTNFASFPVSGTIGKVYADKASNLIYRWTGSAYQLLSPFATLEYNLTDATVWNNGKGNISGNTTFGESSFISNTIGNENSAFGTFSMYSSIGSSRNSAFGNRTLIFLNSGEYNTAIGFDAGSAISAGFNTISNNSIYIGASSRALGNAQTNQIVIGFNAVGAGSNTATLGNTSITTTRLRGAVQGGSFVKDGGTSSEILLADGTVVNSSNFADSSIITHFKKGVQFFTDFDNTASNVTGFLNNNSGAGTTAVLSTSTIPNRVSNQQGFAQYQTGTTSGSYFFHQTNLSHGQFGFGGGTWVYQTSLAVETLSDATDRFRFIAGFGIGNFATSETDAVLFTYDEGGTTNGTSASPNWQVVTSSNNVRTVTNTGVAVVAGQWATLRIEINAAASSVVFKINNTTVATHTTNIPTFSGGRFVNLKQGITKSAGTANRSVFCDYIGYENNLTTPR